MTQSIKALYDAILAATTRDELIVIETTADNPNLAMLCAVSMDRLNVTPLAVIYAEESKESLLAPFTGDDDQFLLEMEIRPSCCFPIRTAPSSATEPID